MPEARLIPLFVTAFAALLAWAALRQFGGKKFRPYAVPMAGAILIVGVDFSYDLPIWAYAIAIFIAPALFHRGVRGKLRAAAQTLTEIKVEAADIRLLLADDLSGKPVALWRIAPLEGQGAPAGLPLATLDFEGETNDEYQIVLWAPLKPFKPVSLVIHHEQAETLAGRLTAAPVVDVSDAPDWMIIRAEPLEFALQLLDSGTLALLRAILGLRHEEREAVVQIDGGAARVILNRTVSKHELVTLLAAFGAWHARLCAALVAFSPREF